MIKHEKAIETLRLNGHRLTPQRLIVLSIIASGDGHMGVDEVYQIGGAQAVAALAYGTESIKRVHKIVGPGNRWVAAAKRLVYGVVGVDSLAGPSEVVVLAEKLATRVERKRA